MAGVTHHADQLRLSPAVDSLWDPNPSNRIPIAFNRVSISIRKTHFECRERYNLNLSILSPGDPFTEKGSLLALVVEEDLLWVLNYLPVALPKYKMGLIF
jgi:hypothetical protein